MSSIFCNVAKKIHDDNLNPIGFLAATLPLEEDLEHQETLTLKEPTTSKYESNFIKDVEQEIKNHTSRKHWKHYAMSEVP